MQSMYHTSPSNWAIYIYIYIYIYMCVCVCVCVCVCISSECGGWAFQAKLEELLFQVYQFQMNKNCQRKCHLSLTRSIVHNPFLCPCFRSLFYFPGMQCLFDWNFADNIQIMLLKENKKVARKKNSLFISGPWNFSLKYIRSPCITICSFTFTRWPYDINPLYSNQ